MSGADGRIERAVRPLQFDVPTVLALQIASSAVAGALLASSGRGRGGPGLGEAYRAAFFLAAGWTLQLLRGVAPDVLSIVAGNVLLWVGALHVRQSYERFASPTRKARWPAMLVAGASVLFFALWRAGGDYASRAIATSLVGAALLASAVWELVRANGLEAEPSRRICAAMGALTAASLLLRVGMLVPQVGAPPVAFFTATLERTLAFVPSLLLAQGFGLSFVVMQRERSEAKLRAAASTDALTGCENRRGLEERALSELEYARRKGVPLGLVVIDLDRFKRVNDQHGHAVGDALLRHVARVLGEALRPSDVVARYGGEEFCVLLRDADAGAATAVARRLAGAIRRAEMLAAGTRVPMTASMGVASFDPASDEEWEALFRRADAAMYRAKEGGRDRVEAA